MVCSAHPTLLFSAEHGESAEKKRGDRESGDQGIPDECPINRDYAQRDVRLSGNQGIRVLRAED
jgi:hypothetical protein